MIRSRIYKTGSFKTNRTGSLTKTIAFFIISLALIFGACQNVDCPAKEGYKIVGKPKVKDVNDCRYEKLPDDPEPPDPDNTIKAGS